MVCNVARHYHWNPDLIEDFYLDDIDFHGIEFWNDDIARSSKEVTDKIKKT